MSETFEIHANYVNDTMILLAFEGVETLALSKEAQSKDIKGDYQELLTILISRASEGQLSIEGYKIVNEKTNSDYLFFDKRKPQNFYKLENIENHQAKRIFVSAAKNVTIDHWVGGASADPAGDKKSLQAICSTEHQRFETGQNLKQDLPFNGQEGNVYQFSTINATIYVGGKKYTAGSKLFAYQLKEANVVFDKGMEGHVILCAASVKNILPNQKEEYTLVGSLNYLPKK